MPIPEPTTKAPSWEQTVQENRHRRGNTPLPGTADTPAPAAKKAPATKAPAKKAPASKRAR